MQFIESVLKVTFDKIVLKITLRIFLFVSYEVLDLVQLLNTYKLDPDAPPVIDVESSLMKIMLIFSLVPRDGRL